MSSLNPADPPDNIDAASDAMTGAAGLGARPDLQAAGDPQQNDTSAGLDVFYDPDADLQPPAPDAE